MNKFVEKILEMTNWFNLFIYGIKPRAEEIKTKESRDRVLKNIADFHLFTFFQKKMILLNLISILRNSFTISSEFI